MGSIGKAFSTLSINTVGEFIDSDKNNPFARIACRIRTLTPTICDGTCGNCKKDRDNYLELKSERIFQHEKANPIYGPDLDQVEEPSRADIIKRLQAKFSRIDDTKRTIIAKRMELVMTTAVRMNTLEALAHLSDTGEQSTS